MRKKKHIWVMLFNPILLLGSACLAIKSFFICHWTPKYKIIFFLNISFTNLFNIYIYKLS